MKEPPFTILETAARLKVSRVKVYDLIRSGQLASFTIGRSRRVPAEAVEAFIATRLRSEAGAT